MRLAVVSDTHSRLETVRQVVELLHARGVDCVLHCGDIEDVETVWLFAGLPTHFVLGNCDYDPPSLHSAARESGATLHESHGELELAGRKIAFIHGHQQRLFHQLEHSGRFDYLFYGHTHVAREHRTGPTRVINPGALHRARPKSFVILDLEHDRVESVEVVG